MSSSALALTEIYNKIFESECDKEYFLYQQIVIKDNKCLHFEILINPTAAT